MSTDEWRGGMVRLKRDGSNAGFQGGSTASPWLAATQTDGKILMIDATPTDGKRRLLRLNPDGSLDASFNPNVVTGGSAPDVNALVVPSNDDLLIGGSFTTVNGLPRPYLARLHGSFGDEVRFLTFQQDGNGSIMFSFNTQSNKTHTVEYKGALTDPAWTALQSFPGDGAVKTLSDPRTTGARRFYRVRLE